MLPIIYIYEKIWKANSGHTKGKMGRRLEMAEGILKETDWKNADKSGATRNKEQRSAKKHELQGKQFGMRNWPSVLTSLSGNDSIAPPIIVVL